MSCIHYNFYTFRPLVDNVSSLVYNRKCKQQAACYFCASAGENFTDMAIKDSILKTLTESRGSYISGEELSASLDVSRAAVWKAIKTLRDEGYSIEAVTNKGYRMPPAGDAITEASIRYALPPELRSSKCFFYDTIDSTNMQAKRLLLSEEIQSGSAIFANHQTAGRGRLGRGFFSPENGIYLSVIIKPDFDISRSVLVTVAAAAAVAKAIEDVCSQDARIKWVNDIYVDSSKVCGILTEAVTDFESGQIESLVIGIGINTSTEGFPEELKGIAGAVDLERAAATGNIPASTNAKSLLAAEVVRLTVEYTSQIAKASPGDAPAFLDIYREKSMIIGRDIHVFKGAYRADPTSELNGIPAKAVGIDNDGGLQVVYENGTEETLTTGEVTIRL